MDILLLTLNLKEGKDRQKERERTLEFNNATKIQILSSDQPLTSANSPDSVAGTTVPPSTLNLLESINAALLPPEAAAGPVNVVDPWFGVYCKV